MNLNNTQMLHICAEIIVLIGVVYYINARNKTLISCIEDISTIIDDQQEEIQKLQLAYKQLNDQVLACHRQMQSFNNILASSQQSKPASPKVKIDTPSKRLANTPLDTSPPIDTPLIDTPPIDTISDNSDYEETSTVLDAELQSELGELTEDNLKKQEQKTKADV